MNQTEIDELRKIASSFALLDMHIEALLPIGSGTLTTPAATALRALPRLLAALEEARAEAKRAKSELDGVMHSVDKWFDDDDPRLTADNPATRASTAREIALQWGEKAEAERDLMEKKVITCGVAATHPDPLLTATKTCYSETWNSPQAEEVRALRADRDAAESLAWDALGRPDGTHDTSNVRRLCEAYGATKAKLAALAGYVIDHRLDCEFDPPNAKACTCGLTELIAAAKVQP